MGKLKTDDIDTTSYSSQSFANTSLYEASTTHKDFYSVDAKDTDGYAGGEEYTYYGKWTTWHGYYRSIASFSAVIDKLASWTVGRGYKASLLTKLKLMRIRGFGKDDFNSLIENLVRVMLLNGDSFAEINKDKAIRLINLKVLNPGSMSIIVNKSGMLSRYEQHARNSKVKTIEFNPEKIFHLAWNRIADECHGIPFAEKVELILKAKQEAFLLTKVLMRRHVNPVLLISTGIDNTTEVTRLKTKINNAYKNTENVFMPAGTIDKIESISTAQYSTIDPLPWLKYLQREYVTTCGVPEVIMGWGEETTEASSKVIYLAFEQTIRRIQRFLEEQLRLQLGLKIKFEFPASLEQDLQRDNKKDGPMNSGKKSDLDPNKKTK